MKILIATDGSDYCKAAIAEACKFIVPAETEVNVVSAAERIVPGSIDPGELSEEYQQMLDETLVGQAERNVKDAEADLRKCFPGEKLNLTTQVIRGNPDRVIIEEAEEWGANLIVVGCHGKGFWGRLMGSVSSAIVHHAPCSVLVVRKPSQAL